MKGVNLNERAANVGGSLVVESDALAEIKGPTDTPVSYTHLVLSLAPTIILAVRVLDAACVIGFHSTVGGLSSIISALALVQSSR